MFSSASHLYASIGKKIQSKIPWIFLILIIFLVVGVRWRMRAMPLERDEGEYAYAGQMILQNIPPYKLSYNMKLPGTYAAYAILMVIFGESASGIHLGLILINVTAVILIFLLGDRLLDKVSAVVAAATYALMAMSPSVLGLQAHATHFVVVPVLGGAFILLNAANIKQLRWLFVSGLLFGIGFLMKQHGALLGLFGLSYLIWETIFVKSRERRRQHLTKNSYLFSKIIWEKWVTFCFGMAVPYLLTCIVLWRAGVSKQFFFWTISYANKYITAVPLGNASQQLRYAINMVTSPNLFFWLLAMVGMLMMWWDGRLERKRFFVVAFFICSLMSISIGFYFREHYFILLLPILSLTAGIAVSRGIHVLKHERTLELIPALTVLFLFVIGLGSEVLTNSSFWFEFTPDKACRQIYGSTLFPQSLRIGKYIETNSEKDSTIAVIGSEPEIYFYSHRHSATGYIYMYPLMEHHEYALKMQEEMIAEIESACPEFVVFVDLSESWLERESSHKRLKEWWSNYQKINYKFVQTIEIEKESYDEGNIGAERFINSGYGISLKGSERTLPRAVSAGSVTIFRRRNK